MLEIFETICVQTNLFKNKVFYKLFAYKSYVYIYKQDLAFNNPQELICH